MYAGRPCPLRLRCENRLAGVVIDRFGQEVSLVPDGEGHFTATVDVVASPPLWGWLFGLGPGVEVLSPDWAVEEFTRQLQAVWTAYNSPSDGADSQAESAEKPEAGD